MAVRRNEEIDSYLVALGGRVREARAKRGMSRRILAHASGVSERYLAQLESGAGNPSITVLRRISAAVDYPFAELISSLGRHNNDRQQLHHLINSAPESILPMLRTNLELWFAEGGGPDKKRRIALIGLRGAGKSTLGSLLAGRLGVPFIELNRIVEQEYGGNIAEIFSFGGQSAFRRHERRCLDQVIADYERVVIATGGGIVSEAATYSLLLEKTHTIWLRATPNHHMQRVVEQGDSRPMARNKEAMDDLKAILHAREPYHRMADAVVDTSGQTIEQSLEELSGVAETLLANGQRV